MHNTSEEALKVSKNITNHLRCTCTSENIIQEQDSSRQNNQKRSNQTKLQQYLPNRCMFFASENDQNNSFQEEGKAINSSSNQGNYHATSDNLMKRCISAKITYDNCTQQAYSDRLKDNLEVHNDDIMSYQNNNILTSKKPSENIWQSYFFSDSVNPSENLLKNKRSSEEDLTKRRSSMLRNLAHNGSNIHSVKCSKTPSPSKGITNLKSKGISQSRVNAKSAYLSKDTRSQSTKVNNNLSKEKRNTTHSCLDFLKELNELKVKPVKHKHIFQFKKQDSKQLMSQNKQHYQQQNNEMKIKETELRSGTFRVVGQEPNKSKLNCNKLRTQKEWRTLINGMTKKTSLHTENPAKDIISMEDVLKSQKTLMRNIPQQNNLRLTHQKNLLFSKYLESTSLHIQDTREISEYGSQHIIGNSQKSQESESGASTQRNNNTSILNISKLTDMIISQKQMEQQLLTPRGKETESEKQMNYLNRQYQKEDRSKSEEKVLDDVSSRCSRRKGEDQQLPGVFMIKQKKTQEQQYSPEKEISQKSEEKSNVKRKYIISTPIDQKSKRRLDKQDKQIFTENIEQEKQLRSLQGDYYYYNQNLHNRNYPEKAPLTLFSNWFAEKYKINKNCHNNTTSDAIKDGHEDLENEGSETNNFYNNLSNVKVSSMTSEESACCRVTFTSTTDLSRVERVNTEPIEKDKKQNKKKVVIVNQSAMQKASISDGITERKDKRNTIKHSVHSERVQFNNNIKSSPQLFLGESHNNARFLNSHGSVYSSNSKNDEINNNIVNNLNQSNSEQSDGLQTWDLCQDYWVINNKEFKGNNSLGYGNQRNELLLAKKSDWSLWEAIEKPRRLKVSKYKNIQQKDTQSQSLMEMGKEREQQQCIADDILIGLTTMEINSFEALQVEINASQVNNKCKKVLAGQLYKNSKTVGVVREWECYGNLSEMLSVSGLLNEKIISVILKSFLQILIETIRETGWMTRIDHGSIHFDANCQVILGLNIGIAMNVDLSFLYYISNIHLSQSCFEIESLQHLEQKSQQVSEEQKVISQMSEEDQQIPKSDSSTPSYQTSEISLKKPSNDNSQMQGSSQESMRNFMANCRKYNIKSNENISTTERGLSVSKTCLLDEEDLVFELGFIILKSLIGQEYVLFNRNYFFANTLGPAFSKNLKENILKKSSNCCFFHDLKKIVQSSDINAFIDLKRAKELCGFLEKNCSECLLKILCGSMKYKKTERMTLASMKETLDNGSEMISQQKQTIILRHLFEQLRAKQSLSQRNSENHLKHEKTLIRIAKTLQKSGSSQTDLAGKIARQIAIKFYMHTNEVLQVLSEKS